MLGIVIKETIDQMTIVVNREGSMFASVEFRKYSCLRPKDISKGAIEHCHCSVHCPINLQRRIPGATALLVKVKLVRLGCPLDLASVCIL
jgi:hypothetical protein